MRKLLSFLIASCITFSAHAWWPPSHLIPAMIPYKFLPLKTKSKVDELTKLMEQDYKGVNNINPAAAYCQILKAGDSPSELYLKNRWEIVKQRLAIGGYQLAMILNELFDSE